jgi:hypothetical protein
MWKHFGGVHDRSCFLGSPPSSAKHRGRRLRSALHLIGIMLSEYRRAVAAQRRYEDLRRHGPTLARMGVTDISRHLFREFYVNTPEKPMEAAPWQSKSTA